MSSAAKTPRRPAAANFYRPETWRREESIGYLMGRTIALLKEAVDEELEPTGLTHAQWVPLLKLYLGEAGTVAELARASQLDVGAMTRTLDRLEMKGLIRRVRSSEDRRVVNVELTAEGSETARQIPGVLCRVQNAHLSGFTREEWQLLKGLMSRLLDNALQHRHERQGKTNP